MPRRKTIGVPKTSATRRITTSSIKRHYSRDIPCPIIKAEEASPEPIELASIIKREEDSPEAMALTPSTTQMEGALPEPMELAPIIKREEDSSEPMALTPPSATQTEEASPASSYEPKPEPERNPEAPSTPSNCCYDVHECQPLVPETERNVRVKLILYPPAPPPSPVFTIRLVLNA
jgi:hypothetical protein